MPQKHSRAINVAVKPIGEVPLNLPIRLYAAPAKQDIISEHVSHLLGIEADGEATATAVETVARDIVVINALSHNCMILI